MTQTYLIRQAITAPFTSRAASAARGFARIDYAAASGARQTGKNEPSEPR